MSNSLNENIEGKIVLLEDGKAVYCESGFGCYDFTIGSALCGVTVPDEQTIKTSGHSVVRILEDWELKRVGLPPLEEFKTQLAMGRMPKIRNLDI